MLQEHESLESVLARCDRTMFSALVEEAEQQRQQILDRFPQEHWSRMTLQEYALGQEDSEDTHCRWMEFRSQALGSIRGGSARKLIIFKRKSQPGWFFPKTFDNEQAAWEQVRNDFIRGLEHGEKGEWDKIDELEALGWGPALKLKTLNLYFPEEILPIFSKEHMTHFMRVLKRPKEEMVGYTAIVQLNRHLRAALRDRRELQNWSMLEIARLLYFWSDPRESRRVVKIAPGENARFWPDCLEGGFICLGWDGIGDLRDFESKQVMRERFREVYGAEYRQHSSQITKKANELWTLLTLQPGDLVVANQGKSRVLAVGEVLEPGYEHRDDRPEYKHVLSVRWDTSYAKPIPVQKRWQSVTVANVPDALLETILARDPAKPGDDPPVAPPVPVAPIYPRISGALERKGQLILYGPPGTGKTYTARRFAAWWLLRKAGQMGADGVLADSERLAAAECQLSTARVTGRVWWIVANPKEWSWDQLFTDGKVEYSRGRLQRNYPLVQRGDWVVGYQSTPDKRIMALARVSREFQGSGGKAPSIELEPLIKEIKGRLGQSSKPAGTSLEGKPKKGGHAPVAKQPPRCRSVCETCSGLG